MSGLGATALSIAMIVAIASKTPAAPSMAGHTLGRRGRCQWPIAEETLPSQRLGKVAESVPVP